jgi:WhiB family redox-sensing transcriptional regulator
MKLGEPTWMELSACKTYSAVNADWYADPGVPEQKLAISICQGVCQVREQCLDYAIATEERHGVWGGYTVSQRQVLARKKGQLRFSELALRDR